MPTVYARISGYCQKNKKAIPSAEFRNEIGKRVIKAWFSPSNKMKVSIQRIKSEEPDGAFMVIAYPKKFVPVIDKIIDEWFHSLKSATHPIKNRERKRIPVKRPIYFSSKRLSQKENISKK